MPTVRGLLNPLQRLCIKTEQRAFELLEDRVGLSTRKQIPGLVEKRRRVVALSLRRGVDHEVVERDGANPRSTIDRWRVGFVHLQALADRLVLRLVRGTELGLDGDPGGLEVRRLVTLDLPENPP